jgi:hypothetical protein
MAETLKSRGETFVQRSTEFRRSNGESSSEINAAESVSEVESAIPDRASAAVITLLGER